MPTKAVIMDGEIGLGQYSGVTSIGEVVISGYGNFRNNSIFQSVAAQANFFGPIAGQQFLITSMFMDGNNTDVTIFEASSQFTSVIDKTLVKIHLQANAILPISFPFGGFLAVSEGKYLNAINTAGTTNINIVGHYVPITKNVT
jgi:hypothetical protein